MPQDHEIKDHQDLIQSDSSSQYSSQNSVQGESAAEVTHVKRHRDSAVGVKRDGQEDHSLTTGTSQNDNNDLVTRNESATGEGIAMEISRHAQKAGRGQNNAEIVEQASPAEAFPEQNGQDLQGDALESTGTEKERACITLASGELENAALEDGTSETSQPQKCKCSVTTLASQNGTPQTAEARGPDSGIDHGDDSPPCHNLSNSFQQFHQPDTTLLHPQDSTSRKSHDSTETEPSAADQNVPASAESSAESPQTLPLSTPLQEAAVRTIDYGSDVDSAEEQLLGDTTVNVRSTGHVNASALIPAIRFPSRARNDMEEEFQLDYEEDDSWTSEAAEKREMPTEVRSVSGSVMSRALTLTDGNTSVTASASNFVSSGSSVQIISDSHNSLMSGNSPAISPRRAISVVSLSSGDDDVEIQRMQPISPQRIEYCPQNAEDLCRMLEKQRAVEFIKSQARGLFPSVPPPQGASDRRNRNGRTRLSNSRYHSTGTSSPHSPQQPSQAQGPTNAVTLSDDSRKLARDVLNRAIAASNLPVGSSASFNFGLRRNILEFLEYSQRINLPPASMNGDHHWNPCPNCNKGGHVLFRCRASGFECTACMDQIRIHRTECLGPCVPCAIDGSTECTHSFDNSWQQPQKETRLYVIESSVITGAPLDLPNDQSLCNPSGSMGPSCVICGRRHWTEKCSSTSGRPWDRRISSRWTLDSLRRRRWMWGHPAGNNSPHSYEGILAYLGMSLLKNPLSPFDLKQSLAVQPRTSAQRTKRRYEQRFANTAELFKAKKRRIERFLEVRSPETHLYELPPPIQVSSPELPDESRILGAQRPLMESDHAVCIPEDIAISPTHFQSPIDMIDCPEDRTAASPHRKYTIAAKRGLAIELTDSPPSALDEFSGEDTRDQTVAKIDRLEMEDDEAGPILEAGWILGSRGGTKRKALQPSVGQSQAFLALLRAGLNRKRRKKVSSQDNERPLLSTLSSPMDSSTSLVDLTSPDADLKESHSAVSFSPKTNQHTDEVSSEASGDDCVILDPEDQLPGPNEKIVTRVTPSTESLESSPFNLIVESNDAGRGPLEDFSACQPLLYTEQGTFTPTKMTTKVNQGPVARPQTLLSWWDAVPTRTAQQTIPKRDCLRRGAKTPTAQTTNDRNRITPSTIMVDLTSDP